MNFSIERRKQDIQTLKEETLDVLIIGGGITGAGIALQASASGLKTGLVEMQDFAEGTSSRSTKLVHGGIRYLKNFDVEVVADTVQERAVVQGVAPHIPKADPMILPIYDEPGSTFSMFSLKVAMDLYDRLAGVTGTKYANYTLTKEEVLERLPQLNPKGLLGAGVYLDFRNNDARLVIENIKQAAADGGHMVSRMKVIGILHDEKGKVSGAEVEDLLSGERFEINARVVLNSTGPWSDTIRQMDNKLDVLPQMRPTKGVHLVVDREKLQVPQPTYFDTGKKDGRMVFVIPREEKTYFGTTDTDYNGDFAHPIVEQDDVDYLLEVVNTHYPSAKLTIDDIESSWAGLRPLISTNGGSDYNGGNNQAVTDESFDHILSTITKYQEGQTDRNEVESALKNIETSNSESDFNPSAISRGSTLDIDEDGLLTVAGGKITDYRKMALGAMKKVIEILEQDYSLAYELIDSTKYPVSGGNIDPSKVEEETEKLAQIGIEKGLSESEALYLANLYGSNAPRVFSLLDDVEKVAGLNAAEAVSLRYAMDEEMTLTPSDFLIRRTNHMLFKRDTLDSIKESVIREMARYNDWSDELKANYTKELEVAIAESDLKHLKGDKK
ncbi:type 1 glycerol-3-phosphate oxidase [Marinilactibacillus psychrotolerans]|uniref:Alpha-glycerophosphate oxidase n=1 Tax=Marinilactibacillus psychrotolerans TaxID=191770 RepID=A0AAV3WP92_9LACT|nr:type 1 glycerol-3-phosphate oxidase [Marinilactibacillus psychrotolerans]GEL67138.1 alpha-glycerophosphate oxidase [Marinilactibacillus psychrotolerans]GEQ35449.1 glycerol-3-phosphate dehydrogenase [Marinilactibacillus psychrotolerans]SDC88482.1 alpha-glycerophosphate oxidase [Marinilactibacillus psychrotolerans]